MDVKEVKNGSIIAISEILTIDESSESDLKELEKVLGALQKVAVSSMGYLDETSISIKSSGEFISEIN